LSSEEQEKLTAVRPQTVSCVLVPRLDTVIVSAANVTSQKPYC